MDYEPIICFETHVELKTKSKLFCNCEVSYDAAPNSRVCPVCTGQPGALPVLNKTAVEYAIRAGLALNCTINRLSRFARKIITVPAFPCLKS
jgi:aspartyl-tRNA(Asn)/glutamyl-tRNA(Gln) amidotransferase subunit B